MSKSSGKTHGPFVRFVNDEKPLICGTITLTPVTDEVAPPRYASLCGIMTGNVLFEEVVKYNSKAKRHKPTKKNEQKKNEQKKNEQKKNEQIIEYQPFMRPESEWEKPIRLRAEPELYKRTETKEETIDGEEIIIDDEEIIINDEETIDEIDEIDDEEIIIV